MNEAETVYLCIGAETSGGASTDAGQGKRHEPQAAMSIPYFYTVVSLSAKSMGEAKLSTWANLKECFALAY